MSLEFTEMDKENISWSKTNINILISQYREISNRLWHITLLLLVEAVGFIAALLIILIEV